MPEADSFETEIVEKPCGYSTVEGYYDGTHLLERIFWPPYVLEFSEYTKLYSFIWRRETVEILPSPFDAFLYYLVLDPNNPILGQWTIWLLALVEAIKGIIATIQVILEVKDKLELTHQENRGKTIREGVVQFVGRAAPKLVLAGAFLWMGLGGVPYGIFLLLPGVMLFDTFRALTRVRKNYQRARLLGRSAFGAAISSLSGFSTKLTMLLGVTAAFFMPLTSLPVLILGGLFISSYLLSITHNIRDKKVPVKDKTDSAIVVGDDSEKKRVAKIDSSTHQMKLLIERKPTQRSLLEESRSDIPNHLPGARQVARLRAAAQKAREEAKRQAREAAAASAPREQTLFRSEGNMYIQYLARR